MIKRYLVCDKCGNNILLESHQTDNVPTIEFDIRGYKEFGSGTYNKFSVCEDCYNEILEYAKEKLKTVDELIECAKDELAYSQSVFKSNRTFSEALIYLKQGYFIRRKGWDIFLKIDTKNVILVSDSQGYLTWNSYQSDIMADDWEIFKK